MVVLFLPTFVAAIGPPTFSTHRGTAHGLEGFDHPPRDIGPCLWLHHAVARARDFRGRALDPELLPISQRTSGKDAKIKQGVTGMSQQRYVRYMEQIFNEGGYHSKRLILDRLVIHTTMKMDSDGGCDPWFLIEENCHEVYDWRKVSLAPAL